MGTGGGRGAGAGVGCGSRQQRAAEGAGGRMQGAHSCMHAVHGGCIARVIKHSPTCMQMLLDGVTSRLTSQAMSLTGSGSDGASASASPLQGSITCVVKGVAGVGGRAQAFPGRFPGRSTSLRAACVDGHKQTSKHACMHACVITVCRPTCIML